MYKVVNVVYFIAIVCLFLYSFTQVDLGLTLTRWPVWQENIQQFFQHIGYFDRPLSTALFVIITLLLSTSYIFILRLVRKGHMPKKQIWMIILFASALLTFSYNAFSYDLFNYVFDAKIVTYYHQNPYEHKALDYPGEFMLSFMHWTHRTYPYGPVWLGLTIPISFVFGKFFLPTLVLFKLLASVSYIGSAYYIGKILKKIKPGDEIFGVAFFALNPLVVIESLVSSHLDIVMMFFAVLSLYLLIEKKILGSLVMIILSAGVKFATAAVAPLFVLYALLGKKKISFEQFIFLCIIAMIATVVLASQRTNFQPWYILPVLPFAALIAKKSYIFIPTTVISLFSLLQYVPFLYLGNWDKPVPTILFWLTTSSIVLSVLLLISNIIGKKAWR